MENWWCNFNKIRRNILIRESVWVRRVFSVAKMICIRHILFFVAYITIDIEHYAMVWSAHTHSTWNGCEQNNFFCQNHLQMVIFSAQSQCLVCCCFCCLDPLKCDFNVHLCKLKISTLENHWNQHKNRASLCVCLLFWCWKPKKAAALSEVIYYLVGVSKSMNQNQEKCWYI